MLCCRIEVSGSNWEEESRREDGRLYLEVQYGLLQRPPQHRETR